MPAIQLRNRETLPFAQHLLNRNRNRVVLLTLKIRRRYMPPGFVRLLREKRAEGLPAQLLYMLLRYLWWEVVVENVCGVLRDDVSVILFAVSSPFSSMPKSKEWKLRSA